jgi:hypothetical protein
MKTIHAVFTAGVFRPTEPVDLPDGTEVDIPTPDRQGKPPPRYLTYGKYPGEQSTLEDFKVAEWHGDEELENQDGQ